MPEFFDVGGVRLAANVTGDAGGMPLVLLHGGGMDRTTWDAVAPTFEPTHRVYAVDLRGFGESDRPGAYSFELMRDDVIGLLDAVGAERADLVGHSMGGTVAWLVAQRQPDRVGRLVVEDSPPPRKGVMRSSVTDTRPPAEPPPFDWDALVAVVGQINDPDPAWWDGIGLVTAPTLLLAGGASSHVPQGLLAEVAELLLDGRLVEVPVGHRIHGDAPEEFLRHVVRFLNR